MEKSSPRISPNNCTIKLGSHFSFGWAENHQSNPIERFHQTLYKLVNSLRAEGESNFIEGVKTAVMLYNGAKHMSTGVTPNILFLGREVVLPTDLLLGEPLLGPDNGTPNKIVDQMLRQAQQHQRVAQHNQLKDIHRNIAHYLNPDWHPALGEGALQGQELCHTHDQIATPSAPRGPPPSRQPQPPPSVHPRGANRGERARQQLD